MLSTPFFFNFHPHQFGNHIEDFSSHLLFEATGDSEADSLVGHGSSTVSVEFNDAESCTDDTPAMRNKVQTYENDDDDDDDDENEEEVESKPIGFMTESSASIDSAEEFKMLNEVEKNRLFWETCLAS
ncbi:hypothetical protein SDJN02_24581, partial [Cucurbita argyrosperma subsp. argyrosperma]